MLNNAEQHVAEMSEDLPEITRAIRSIFLYLSGDYYESKNIRLAQWIPTGEELHELVIAIFTITLQGHQVYQSLMGMIASRIPMDDQLDRLKTIAEVIAVVSKSELIRITKQGAGQSILIDTEFEPDSVIPAPYNHEICFHKPKLIKKNKTFQQGSMILGSHFNYHEGNICLDHINRLNAIKFSLNKDFLLTVYEQPKHLIHTLEQQVHWDNFVRDSADTYINIINHQNKFHLYHKYDARGRCYAVGYHVNYQGSSFKKAIIQLANKEICND